MGYHIRIRQFVGGHDGLDPVCEVDADEHDFATLEEALRFLHEELTENDVFRLESDEYENPCYG